MLSPDQKRKFERVGLLRLPAAIPTSDVVAMRDAFWEFLGRKHGIDRHRKETWTTRHPRHLQALNRSGAFDPMATDAVEEALDDLLGRQGWKRPRTWGKPLVTFPGPSPWTVPVTGWHVDSHGPEHALPGVTVFAFLSEVALDGGGTAVVPGSHRLVNDQIGTTGRWRNSEAKSDLAARHPWVHNLWHRDAEIDRVTAFCTEGTEIDGDHYRVEQLTGTPGDVVLMHPRTLHTPAPNVLDAPRMMLVEIVNRIAKS